MKMTKKNQAAYSNAVNRIRALLANWLESGVELFLALKEVDDSGVWKAPGHATFSDFLKEEFPTALGMERYQNVTNAIQIYGVEFVRKHGVHVCHAITKEAVVSNPTRINEVKRSMDDHLERKGASPDSNTVRDIVRGIAPELVKPHQSTRNVRKVDELQFGMRSLAQENRELKVKIAQLEKEIKAKDKLIAKLQLKELV